MFIGKPLIAAIMLLADILLIIQIPDIHSGSFDNTEAVSEGIEAVLAENPGPILFTGDIVNGRADEPEPYIQVFKRLKAPLGVYSVPGNHDYGGYVRWPSQSWKIQNLEKLKQNYKEMGWGLLENEHVLPERNQKQIAPIGV